MVNPVGETHLRENLCLVGVTNLKEGVMLGKSPLSLPFYMHSISPFHSILVQRHRFSLRRVSPTGFTVEVLVQPLCSIIILFLVLLALCLT